MRAKALDKRHGAPKLTTCDSRRSAASLAPRNTTSFYSPVVGSLGTDRLCGRSWPFWIPPCWWIRPIPLSATAPLEILPGVPSTGISADPAGVVSQQVLGIERPANNGSSWSYVIPLHLRASQVSRSVIPPPRAMAAFPLFDKAVFTIYLAIRCCHDDRQRSRLTLPVLRPGWP